MFHYSYNYNYLHCMVKHKTAFLHRISWTVWSWGSKGLVPPTTQTTNWDNQNNNNNNSNRKKAESAVFSDALHCIFQLRFRFILFRLLYLAQLQAMSWVGFNCSTYCTCWRSYAVQYDTTLLDIVLLPQVKYDWRRTSMELSDSEASSKSLLSNPSIGGGPDPYHLHYKPTSTIILHIMTSLKGNYGWKLKFITPMCWFDVWPTRALTSTLKKKTW